MIAEVLAVVMLITGRHVDVRCVPGYPPWAGEYVPQQDRILLDAFECANLIRFHRTGAVDDDTAEAVLTLTHEAEHATLQLGWADETLTECRAIKYARDVAFMLAPNWRTAREISRRLYRLMLPIHYGIRTVRGYGTRSCEGVT